MREVPAEAKQEGMDAWQRGVKYYMNPYSLRYNHHMYMAWATGWKEMEQESTPYDIWKRSKKRKRKR